MTILLADMVADLAEDIPAVEGVPSTEQYERAVKDAVQAFSERCGLIQIGTLNMVSGTATYDLPADFLKMIELNSYAQGDVIHSTQGLIPVPQNWCEQNTIRNGQITFYPIPRYTLTREFRYKAGWVLTIADEDYAVYEYAEMTEREKRIVMLKAKAIATTKKLNQGTTGMKYSLGAVSVDNSGTGETYAKDIKGFESDFETECEKYNGAYITA